ncbi:hypothetical protein EMPS_08102 [Entomortierella parvispora]|uniref:F-box domain-containing protein n=1 Tax=Entomortierella parvispora TaxID=205924 RepID=A0A9P3LZ04_9FUNG|nr:hypothetical protein EMPS_08102 [Entomortierella parvispora]
MPALSPLSPCSNCTCPNSLDCATAPVIAGAAADHPRSSFYSGISPVQESGPDLRPVSSGSNSNSHDNQVVDSSMASSSHLSPLMSQEARAVPTPPLSPSPPSSSLSNLSSRISGLSSPPLPPPPPPSSTLSSASSVVAVPQPSLNLPLGFEAMQDRQFFHHLALQQHCSSATVSQSSATQISPNSTDSSNEMVSSTLSSPSSTSSSRYHSPSSSVVWGSPQRPSKSPLRLPYQVTTPFSDLHNLKKDKGVYRAYHQQSSSITNGLLKPRLSFDALPREVRIHVFRYLSTFQLIRVSRVSRAWRGVAMDGSLWKVIDTTRYYKTIQDKQLRILGTAASGFLRYANFRGCVQLSADSLRAIAEHCPNVEHLDLTGCHSVSSKSIADVCMNMSSLTHLDLAGLQSVNNYTLQAMAVYCRSLQVLNLAWCKQISGTGLSKLTRSCQELRKLNVSGCSALEDRWMPVMGMNLPKLRELCLNGCGSLTDRGLIGLLSGLSVASSKKHRRWRITRRMASSVRVSSLGHLLINQSSCNEDDDQDDADDVDSDGDDGDKDADESENDGDPETIAPVTTTASSNSSMGLQTKLVYLGLSNCRLLTTESLRAIGHHCGQNLCRLELSGCENFGDEGLLIVAQHCRQLRLLDLEDVTLLTDVSLRAFGLNLQKLERICLSYCENVTDQGILRMLRPAPNPTTLSTANQAMLLNNSEAAKQCCGRLVHLELDNCVLITDRILLEFANVIEERKAAAMERLRERERKREERRERIRQKARKIYSSRMCEQAESIVYADEGPHYQEASCSSSSTLSTAVVSSSSFISSAPVNIPDRLNHQRPMAAIHASVASLAGPPSISSYSSSPLQPRSVLASTFMSGEIVLKKTRPGMRIMGPCRSNSLTLPISSVGASSSLGLPYWPTTSSNLQSTSLSRSATVPGYSSRSQINVPTSVATAHSLATLKIRRRRLVRPTLQVFDCRNVTLEGVESAQARCSTLAIKSYYSWSHPSTATAVAATAVSPMSHAVAGFSSSLVGFGNSGDLSSLDGHGNAGLLEFYDDEDEELDEDGNSSHNPGSSSGHGSSSSLNVLNESQSSLHHLQLQHQHLQQQQEQFLSRRSRAARLLHRARMGLIGRAGGQDSPCSIL